MKKQANGKEADWTPEIQALFDHMIESHGGLQEGESIEQANYFTPRPYVDEYNRGSHLWGFIYTLQPGNHVCFHNYTDDPLKVGP